MTNKAEGHRTSPPDFLTVEEAAAVLRIGRTSAYQLARRYLDTDGAEGLCADRFGKQLRIPRGHLEQRLGAPITWPIVLDEIPTTQPIASVTSSQTRQRAGRSISRPLEQDTLPFSA